MSTYGDQVESRNSNQSLLSGRGSDLASRYVMESGCFMSSFAATICIGAIVTVGVLVLTLLVALAVMLGSCQSKDTGYIQHQETATEYDYCNIFTSHLELNNLKADEMPTICKLHVNRYINEGLFLGAMNITVQLAESYFRTLTPDGDGLDVILMDIDDIFLPEGPHNSKLLQYRDKQVEEVKHLAHKFALELYMKLQTTGWSLILFSRKQEKQRNETIDSLISSGWNGWSSLIMRSADELLLESWEYISRKRVELQNQGFHIASVISSRVDALTGPCIGKRNFKLANLIYLESEQHETEI